MKYIILVLLFIQSLSGAQIRPEPDQIVRYKTTEQTLSISTYFCPTRCSPATLAPLFSFSLVVDGTTALQPNSTDKRSILPIEV